MINDTDNGYITILHSPISIRGFFEYKGKKFSLTQCGIQCIIMKSWQNKKTQKPHYRSSNSDVTLKNSGFNDTIDEVPDYFDSSHVVLRWGSMYYNRTDYASHFWTEYQKFLMLKGYNAPHSIANVSVTYLIEPTVAYDWGMDTNLSPQLIAAYITKVTHFLKILFIIVIHHLFIMSNSK